MGIKNKLTLRYHLFVLVGKVRCDVCGKFVSNLAKHKRRGRCKARGYSKPTFEAVEEEIEKRRWGGQMGPDYSGS